MNLGAARLAIFSLCGSLGSRHIFHCLRGLYGGRQHLSGSRLILGPHLQSRRKCPRNQIICIFSLQE